MIDILQLIVLVYIAYKLSPQETQTIKKAILQKKPFVVDAPKPKINLDDLVS